MREGSFVLQTTMLIVGVINGETSGYGLVAMRMDTNLARGFTQEHGLFEEASRWW